MEQTSPDNMEEKVVSKRRKIFPIILTVLVLVGAVFGITKYIHSLHHEETDDAQIDADISPIIPRVTGYVERVEVNDNQMVKKGDTLVVLDDRELQVRLEQAEAALAAAKANLDVARATTHASQAGISASEANVATMEAQIEAARIKVWTTSEDYKRYANLIRDHSITQQQYEQALAAKESAEKQLKIMEEQKKAAAKQRNAVASQSNVTNEQINVAAASVQQRQAEVQQARLNVSYAVITAPANGRVSKINIHPGQLVTAGQSLFSLVISTNIWVTANFKETQLEHIQPGLPAIVHVDAYPREDFHAKVASFAPATGARFALLPPDNASGNFVKVVQRVPVKIVFTSDNPHLSLLRPGMNVTVDVTLN